MYLVSRKQTQFKVKTRLKFVQNKIVVNNMFMIYLSTNGIINSNNKPKCK